MFHLNLCEDGDFDTTQNFLLSLDEFSPFYYKSMGRKNTLATDEFDARHSNFEVSGSCYDKLLSLLSRILNDLHRTEHSQRYWEILIGHWLQIYVDVLINRNSQVQELFQNFLVSKITLYEVDFCQLTPVDTQNFMTLANDNNWNMALYSKMLVFKELDSSRVATFKNFQSETFPEIIQPASTRRETLPRKVLDLFRKFLTRFSRGFVLSSYLPRNLEWLLSIRFLSFPQNGYLPITLPEATLSRTLRHSMVARLGDESKDPFFKMLIALLPELLPTIFVEGYIDLVNATKVGYLPQKARFAFTSNDFETSEVFKAWVAANAEEGMKYLVGQHGNNYGTTRFPLEKIEERTPNAFLTWGWSSVDDRYIPTFNLKNPKGNRFALNRDGGLLLTQICYPSKTSHWDVVADFTRDFNSQLDFVSKLNEEIRARLVIRLHPAHARFKWNDSVRWSEAFPGISINPGLNSIAEVMSKSRLIVHGYDSTGLLESLSANYPSLCFIPGGFWNIRDEALPFYIMLKDIGIIYTDPNELAEKISEIWSDVSGWWEAEGLQQVRRDFCNQYSRVERFPLCKLFGIIANQIR